MYKKVSAKLTKLELLMYFILSCFQIPLHTHGDEPEHDYNQT